MADTPSLPAKFTWYELLDSQLYRLNGVPLSQTVESVNAEATGIQPQISIASNRVWDDNITQVNRFISPSGQAAEYASNWCITTQWALTNPSGLNIGDYLLWLVGGFNNTGSSFTPGGVDATGMFWTTPVDSEGLHLFSCSLEGTPGAGITAGQNWVLTVRQNGQPILQSSGLATGSDSPMYDRACVSGVSYLRPGDAISVELSAGYTTANYVIMNTVLNINRISGVVTGITGA